MELLTFLRLLMTFILLTVSATLLGLTGSSLSWQSRNKENTTLVVNVAEEAYTIFPLYLQKGSSWIVIAAGCGGVADSLLSTFGILRRRPFLGLKVRFICSIYTCDLD